MLVSGSPAWRQAPSVQHPGPIKFTWRHLLCSHTYLKTPTKVRLAAASRNLITTGMKGRAMLFRVFAWLEAAESAVTWCHIYSFVLCRHLNSLCFPGPFLPTGRFSDGLRSQ